MKSFVSTKTVPIRVTGAKRGIETEIIIQADRQTKINRQRRGERKTDKKIQKDTANVVVVIFHDGSEMI